MWTPTGRTTLNCKHGIGSVLTGFILGTIIILCLLARANGQAVPPPTVSEDFAKAAIRALSLLTGGPVTGQLRSQTEFHLTAAAETPAEENVAQHIHSYIGIIATASNLGTSVKTDGCIPAWKANLRARSAVIPPGCPGSKATTPKPAAPAPPTKAADQPPAK